jgi:hypothetical protein
MTGESFATWREDALVSLPVRRSRLIDPAPPQIMDVKKERLGIVRVKILL